MTITSNAVVVFAFSTWIVLCVWQSVSAHREMRRARKLFDEMMRGKEGEE